MYVKYLFLNKNKLSFYSYFYVFQDKYKFNFMVAIANETMIILLYMRINH